MVVDNMGKKLSPGQRAARAVHKTLNKKPGGIRKDVLDRVTQVAKASRRKKK